MKKLIALTAVLLFITITASAQQDLYHLKYGPAKQNTLDLFLPKTFNKTTPVIIVLHGGAWTLGGNEYTDKHARDLRDRGFVVANVDYRYVSDAVHGKDLLKDIDDAFAYLEKESAKYHYKPKDYHIAGISAGAHLSLLYGYTSKRKIKSITAMCAPSNIAGDEMIDAFKKNGHLHVLEQLAGAPLPGPALKAVSPFSQITNVPTQLIHGDKDEMVPYNQSVALYAELQRQNVSSRFITREGKGHDVGMNSPDTEKANIDAIEEWVKKYE